MSEEIKKWEQLSKKLVHQNRIFELYVQRLRSPNGSHEDDFYYFTSNNWVNIIPITANGQVVLVEQYRFGIHELSLEIPGGIIDPGEDPQKAALRELTEETGYVAEDAEFLGDFSPNPAIQTNRLYSYFARDVSLDSVQNLDPAECISVHLARLEEIPDLIINGRMNHSLVISAFFLFAARHGLNGFGSFLAEPKK